MDQTVSYAINMAIITLGTDICIFGIHERRAAVIGIFLIVLGGWVSWVGNVGTQGAPNLAPDDPVKVEISPDRRGA
jgi:hypothetical protein